MTALRCTQKLLKAMKLAPGEPDASPRNRLGDWTATLVRVGRLQLVIAVSEVTRLPIAIDAAPYATVPVRLMAYLAEYLEGLGVPADEIREEIAAMLPLVVSSTRSSSLLGALNSHAMMADSLIYHGQVKSAVELTRRLAEVPVIKPAHIGFPEDRVRELFTLPPRQKMSFQNDGPVVHSLTRLNG